MNKRSKCLCGLFICLLSILMLCGTSAAADEKINVSIPVIATGADCIVALYDSNGELAYLQKVEKDVSSTIVIECNGLRQTKYVAQVFDKDDEDVKYDRTPYEVTINVFYGKEDQLQSSVVIGYYGSGVPDTKEARLRFDNKPALAPTPTPDLPVVTPTPEPYTEKFSFRKVWSGDRENSIDWVMYNSDGTVRSKLFNKKVISEREWYYEAYFQYNVDDCYVIETPIEGYQVIYQNVGKYSDVTDRCYNGGTIINYKVPATSDTTPVTDYTVLVVLSLLGVALLTIRYRRYTVGKKS